MSSRDVLALARFAKAASRTLAILSEGERNAALEAMARAVNATRDELLQANREDMAAAEAAEENGKLPASTLARLQLTDAKIDEMVSGIRSVVSLPDPLSRTLAATELDPENPDSQSRSPQRAGLHLQKITVALGVIAAIFEARPDAVTQIASLAIKSGNAVLLKPGREVERTAVVLVGALRSGLAGGAVPADAVALVLGRDATNDLLGLHGLVDLVIPRGSRQLVEHVQANTRIPVLGHAEGVCHIYVDRNADLSLAVRVIEDAKTDYPAACNAVETVLVHREIAPKFLPMLATMLRDRGAELHGDDTVQAMLSDSTLLPVSDWHIEYGDLALSVAVVDSVEGAIAHIHEHGSAHTESILTEDAETAERFLREVDAAGVFHNCSTRFADGFRYGFGAEVGVSTSKLHARGPVGLDGLTTYKYILRGQGHVAGDYRGTGARAFTHRREAGAP